MSADNTPVYGLMGCLGNSLGCSCVRYLGVSAWAPMHEVMGRSCKNQLGTAVHICWVLMRGLIGQACMSVVNPASLCRDANGAQHRLK